MSGRSIKGGAEVECGGRRFIIMQLIGFDFVVTRDIESGDLVRLAVVVDLPGRAGRPAPATHQGPAAETLNVLCDPECSLPSGSSVDSDKGQSPRIPSRRGLG